MIRHCVLLSLLVACAPQPKPQPAPASAPAPVAQKEQPASVEAKPEPPPETKPEPPPVVASAPVDDGSWCPAPKMNQACEAAAKKKKTCLSIRLPADDTPHSRFVVKAVIGGKPFKTLKTPKDCTLNKDGNECCLTFDKVPLNKAYEIHVGDQVFASGNTSD